MASDLHYGGDPFASSSNLRPGPAAAPRVSQIDADELDEGLVSMLSERVEKSIGNFRSTVSIDLEPEIALVLKLVILRYGLFDPLIRASPGAKLQNLNIDGLRGSRTRLKVCLYLFLHPPIFPTYLLTRIRQYALSKQWPELPNHDWRKKAWKAVVRVENAAKAWELAGWGWFLLDGRYPALLMRLLGLRLVPSSPHLARMVSYEFMNRQLVWGALTEFLMFSIPLLPRLPYFISPSSLINPIRTFLSQPTSLDYDTISLLPARAATLSTISSQAHSGPLASLPKSTCPICHLRVISAPAPLDDSSVGSNFMLPSISSDNGVDTSRAETREETRIFMPAQTDCWGGCRWCYYCIAGELVKHEEKVEAEAKLVKKTMDPQVEEIRWGCLRCGGECTRAWRVGPHPEESIAGSKGEEHPAVPEQLEKFDSKGNARNG